MAVEIKHTLLNLEVAPPAGAWNTISSRLDTEFDVAEISVSQKIGDFEMTPPAAAWENIEGAIVEEPAELEKAPAIIINRPFRKWAVAAAAILLVAMGGWYMLNKASDPGEGLVIVPATKASDKITVPQDAVTKNEVVIVPSTGRPLPRKTITLVAAASKNPVSNNLPEVNPELLAMDLPHAGPQQIQRVSSNSPHVEAPLIRDAKGDIILDKDLIFAPDNNYIVVTGPNGEQTRISSKFLPLLSSLNGKQESLDYFQFFLNENSIWKSRFNEWRDKMMKEASFFPTATNLLDLVELKQILQEN